MSAEGSRGTGTGTATVALVLASILWGTTGTAATFFGSEVSALAIGASTMTVGGILLFAVSARPTIAAFRDAATVRWLLVGAVGVFVYPLAFYTSMHLAGVAIGNVVSLGSGPVFAALFEWLWERRGLSGRWVVSTSIAVAGVVLLGLWGRPAVGTATQNPALGVGLGLLAGLAYALYTYSATRAIGRGNSGRSVMGGTFGLGALALAPVLLLTGAPILESVHNLGIAAYLAVFPMFIAYMLFGIGVRSLPSSVVTTITLLEPIVATFLAIVVLGERLTLIGWFGVILILLGVSVLVTAGPARKGR